MQSFLQQVRFFNDARPRAYRIRIMDTGPNCRYYAVVTDILPGALDRPLRVQVVDFNGAVRSEKIYEGVPDFTTHFFRNSFEQRDWKPYVLLENGIEKKYDMEIELM